MPIKCFDISRATLQDLFTLQSELPVVYMGLMEEHRTNPADVPAAIVVPGRFPWLLPDIEQETYGQSIDAGAAIETMQEDELTGRLRLLAIYFQPAYARGNYNSDRVTDAELVLRWLPAETALSVSDYFLHELTRIQTAVAAEMKQMPYTKEEERAGIKELEKYGPFATLHNLAKSNGKSIHWWVRQPLAYVNTYLKMENDKAHIQRQLHKILNPQNA